MHFTCQSKRLFPLHFPFWSSSKCIGETITALVKQHHAKRSCSSAYSLLQNFSRQQVARFETNTILLPLYFSIFGNLSNECLIFAHIFHQYMATISVPSTIFSTILYACESFSFISFTSICKDVENTIRFFETPTGTILHLLRFSSLFVRIQYFWPVPYL